jgi:hypothetical protein
LTDTNCIYTERKTVCGISRLQQLKYATKDTYQSVQENQDYQNHWIKPKKTIKKSHQNTVAKQHVTGERTNRFMVLRNRDTPVQQFESTENRVTPTEKTQNVVRQAKMNKTRQNKATKSQYVTSKDINDFHIEMNHAGENVLRDTARSFNIKLYGTLNDCVACSNAKSRSKKKSKIAKDPASRPGQ